MKRILIAISTLFSIIVTAVLNEDVLKVLRPEADVKGAHHQMMRSLIKNGPI